MTTMRCIKKGHEYFGKKIVNERSVKNRFGEIKTEYEFEDGHCEVFNKGDIGTDKEFWNTFDPFTTGM